MNPYSFSKAGNDLCLNFNHYHYWESLEELVEIMRERYPVKVVGRLEGPDVKILTIEVNNERFSLQYDSYGSFLKSLSRDNDVLLQEIKNYFESK